MDSNQTQQSIAESVGMPATKEYVFILHMINVATLCQALAVLGSVTNILNMVVFARLGFKDTVNTSLFALAVSDFGSCIVMCVKAAIQNPWFEEQYKLPYQTIAVIRLLIGTPQYVFSRITTAITAFITLERCLCVAMPLKVKSIITKRTVTCFLLITYTLCLLSSAPVYYTQNLEWILDPRRNKSLLTVVYDKNTREIETMFFPVYTAFSVSALALIIVCTVILVVNLKRKANWRKSVTTTTDSSDVSFKEKRISKMISIISSLFIFCYFPKLATMVWPLVDKNFYNVRSMSFTVLNVYVSCVYVLEVMNSAVNIFIYYNNSTNYKNMFKQIFLRKSCDKDSKK